MRIALVAPDCNKRDGQARYVSELAERLGVEHEVHVFSSTFEDTDPRRARHRLVRSPRRATQLRFFVFALSASRALARERFDVVHGLGASCLKMDVLTAEFCQAGWDAALATAALRGLRGSARAGVLRRLIAAIEGRVVADGSIAAVIAVSGRVASELSAFYGRRQGLHVIPNGVDLERFRPRPSEKLRLRQELGLDPTSFLALFVGEFERKNLRSLIEALARERDSRIALVAIGASNPAPFLALAAELGVSERVALRPLTREPELFMAAADAFVFPTLYEPFGMAPLEAAACGLPVIISRRAGFAEWIEDGQNGFVIDDPHDADELGARLRELADSPERARSLGQQARELARRFDWDLIAERTAAVYAGLASSGASAARPPAQATP